MGLNGSAEVPAGAREGHDPPGQLQICLAAPSKGTAPPTCHPEPKAKDLAQEGSDTGLWCVRSFGLRLRMTMGGGAQVLLPKCGGTGGKRREKPLQTAVGGAIMGKKTWGDEV